jgi:glycosyltransferase involved in cell wall biosynthesis
MLPFEWSEARLYGISWFTLKLLLVRILQLNTFRQADGLIFLTEYAQTAISRFLNGTTGRRALIPHGVDERFRKKPKPQRPISTYSAESPFRLLYVSPVAPYKHQWHVMEAVHQLRQMGLPLVLELVGPSYHSTKRFFKALTQWDPNGEWIQYRGEIPFIHLHEIYNEAEVFVYASSCENMPNILLEAMDSGLPIASSNRGPMPEMLDKAAVYFDPEHPVEIANAIKTLVDDPRLREEKSWASYEAAKPYTWKRCAQDTFDFLAHVAQSASARVK